MLENIIYISIPFLFLMSFIVIVAIIYHKLEDQEIKKQIALEKAKQGIFENELPKQSLIKKNILKISASLLVAIIIIFLCYIFKIPSNIAKYILELLV